MVQIDFVVMDIVVAVGCDEVLDYIDLMDFDIVAVVGIGIVAADAAAVELVASKVVVGIVVGAAVQQLAVAPRLAADNMVQFEVIVDKDFVVLEVSDSVDIEVVGDIAVVVAVVDNCHRMVHDIVALSFKV